MRFSLILSGSSVPDVSIRRGMLPGAASRVIRLRPHKKTIYGQHSIIQTCPGWDIPSLVGSGVGHGGSRFALAALRTAVVNNLAGRGK